MYIPTELYDRKWKAIADIRNNYRRKESINSKILNYKANMGKKPPRAGLK